MTCIVGIVGVDGCVYVAGDSAGIADTSCTQRKDPKVFVKDDMAIGFSGSFRFGQIVRYDFKLPKQNNKADHEYLCTSFVNRLRIILERRGAMAEFEGSDDSGDGHLLIGWRGKLYHMDRDFQIGESIDGYDAIGSGSDVAKGALYAFRESAIVSHEFALRTALEAASHHCTTVRGPYISVKTP